MKQTMLGYDLFEYAVLRWVPNVEREEFLNIGVVLYCKNQQFLNVRFQLKLDAIKLMNNSCDVPQLEKNLQSFQQICTGNKSAGKIAELPTAERFRWLTATRSTVLQISAVHPGMCINAAEKLDQLFNQMVL